MKTRHFCAILFLVSVPEWLNAQNLELFDEKTPNGFILYSKNSEFFPISVTLELKLKNLESSGGKKMNFVVPPSTDKYKICELTIKDAGESYGFKSDFKTRMGDITSANYDTSVVYDLPFQSGKTYNLFQGYNGKMTHKNENSLDFTMKIGTEILAAREGTVVQVVQKNSRNCPDKDCMKINNYVTIMHPDGSFASYVHIKYNGAKVNLGDKVNRGDIIALSGNVGYSLGPHLHFVCFKPGFDKVSTIPTKFKVDDGRQAIFLKEGNSYTRNY